MIIKESRKESCGEKWVKLVEQTKKKSKRNEKRKQKQKERLIGI